jgi:hypothetical protein
LCRHSVGAGIFPERVLPCATTFLFPQNLNSIGMHIYLVILMGVKHSNQEIKDTFVELWNELSFFEQMDYLRIMMDETEHHLLRYNVRKIKPKFDKNFDLTYLKVYFTANNSRVYIDTDLAKFFEIYDAR